jgi:hypothetical protein
LSEEVEGQSFYGSDPERGRKPDAVAEDYARHDPGGWRKEEGTRRNKG